MSWISDKTGRPKEEGGHERINISVNEFVSKALEKVGNKSQFLESVALPVLEKLDPGEASLFLWRIDFQLKNGILKATQEGDFKQIQALSWLAEQLEDARKLCGPAPEDLEARVKETIEYVQFKTSSILEETKVQLVTQANIALNQGDYQREWDNLVVLRNTFGNAKMEEADKLIKEKEFQVQFLNERCYYTLADRIVARRVFYGVNGFMKRQCEKLYREIMSQLKLANS